MIVFSPGCIQNQGQDAGGRERLPRPAAREEGRRYVRPSVRTGSGGDELGRDPGLLGPRGPGVISVRGAREMEDVGWPRLVEFYVVYSWSLILQAK